MAKLTDKLFNRIIEGKLVAESGDELPKELPSVSVIDNGKVLLVSGGKWQAGSVSGGTQLYKHSIKCTNSDDDDYWFVLYTTSNEKLETIAKIAEVMRIASMGGNNYMHYAVDGFMNTSRNYFSVNNDESAIIKGTAIGSLTAGSYPVTTIVDTPSPL